MAEVFAEEFEASGYDNAGWSETLDGGVINEDYDRTSVPGAPTNWNTKCLYIDAQGSNNPHTDYEWGSELTNHYVRFEFIVIQDNTSSGSNYAFVLGRSSTPESSWHIGFYKDGSDLKLRFYIDDSLKSTTAAISLNTRYRAEVYYNAGGGWEWRLDGAQQATDTSTGQPGLKKLVIGWQYQAMDQIVAFDNISIDDADWPGAEPEPIIEWTAHEHKTVVF